MSINSCSSSSKQSVPAQTGDLTAVLVSLSDAQSDIKTLTVKSGEQIPLWTGLSGSSVVSQFHWSVGAGSKPETLIDVDEGEVDQNPPERFSGRLFQDTKTGSVNISSARVNDSSIYEGRITAKDNTVFTVKYNVTVLEADLITPTAGPPHDPSAHTRTQPDVAIVVVVVAGVVAVAVAVAVCVVLYKKNKGGQGETVAVTRKAGENITLQTGVTGLHGDDQIFWSKGEERFVIMDFDEGVLVRKTSERFHLDIKTGSLTICSLSINDSGLYQGQIINGNSSQHSFNVTVLEADLITPTAGPPHDPSAHTRTQPDVAIVVVVVAGVVAVAVAVAVCVVLYKKNKGKCWCNSDVI
ncbi:uncharacterized protein LOC128366811 [Scomber japonicus]|uniref:uncharacterized protein LOC128366811 n=1 Tax=Scomber japonicus TaxID=13676 RepID=UPI0023059F6C|nr:uncharacterized protein LOC128366811 [Scomber japonicus]